MAIATVISMGPRSTIDVLNRLLAIEYRSLPMYLSDARPWTHPGDERATSVLAQIVADHKAYSGRIAEAILDRGGVMDLGAFPMEFTDLHLLSLDFLVGELIAYQGRDIADIERCVAELSSDPAAKALAEEVLGNARGHVESLEELSAETSQHNRSTIL